MSAHPKIDPVTGEMICYGYQAKGDLTNDIAVFTVAPDGHIKKEVWLKMPYVGMIHDICITQKHVILPVVGNVTSLERLHSGEPMWEWDASKPTMVAILPRDGEAKDVRWFKGPNRSTLHFLNAVTQGDKVTMELPVGDRSGAPQLVRRWTFDLNSKDENFGEDPMVISPGLLPRMDDRYLSMPYQYGFVGARDASNKFNVYNKFDIHKGIVGTWTAPATTGSLQENTFIPRSAKSPEGDGYVIGVGANTAEMESEIYIIDSMHMEAGPVATIKLPFRLRGGTHTNWFPASQIAV
jgi:carotenoid cleavage dioxygenase